MLSAVALLATLFFGLRSYRSWVVLRSAYALDAPDLGNIRAWMTLGYVARLYGTPVAVLLERLQLPQTTGPDTTLKSLAERRGLAPFHYIQTVQKAIASAERSYGAGGKGAEPGWLSALNDWLLAALLVYGYPALGAILLFGSIGVPLPDGLLTAAAGSLIAQDRMGWATAGIVAVGATVSGDMVGYYLGLFLGEEFLSRRGAWIGYTEPRRRHAQALFARWGWAGVLLTRTLASGVSSVANLAAGASRYRWIDFLSSAVVGRVFWTAAYLGLGYGVGGALEAANGFMGNLTGLLVALIVALWASWIMLRRPQT